MAEDEEDDATPLSLEDRKIVGEVINAEAEDALADGTRTKMREALEFISDVTAPGAILTFDYKNRDVEVESVSDEDDADDSQQDDGEEEAA